MKLHHRVFHSKQNLPLLVLTYLKERRKKNLVLKCKIKVIKRDNDMFAYRRVDTVLPAVTQSSSNISLIDIQSPSIFKNKIETTSETSSASSSKVLIKKPLKPKPTFRPQLQSLPEIDYAEPLDAVKTFIY